MIQAISDTNDNLLNSRMCNNIFNIQSNVENLSSHQIPPRLWIDQLFQLLGMNSYKNSSQLETK